MGREIVLNEEQEAIFKTLQNGEGNLFITGEAGTGKTFVIHHWLNELRAIDPTRAGKVAVLAPTGVAAEKIEGRTYNRLFKVAPKDAQSYSDVIDSAVCDDKIDALVWVDEIIFDEISMLNGRMLTALDQIARIARNIDKPFGGIRLVAVGDFHQLPPVPDIHVNDPMDKKYGITRPENPKARDWAFLSPTWNQLGFEYHYLKEKMRATDATLNHALDCLRTGQLTRRAIDFLDGRVVPKADESFMRIYSKNKDVNAFNKKKMAELKRKKPQKATYQAYFKAEEGFGDKYGAHRRLLQTSRNIEDQIELYVGAKVICTANSWANEDQHYVNGTVGTIVELCEASVIIEADEDGRPIKIKARKTTWKVKGGHTAMTVTYLPLRICFAQTIHKSQGATYTSYACKVDDVWEAGQAYVALSRASSAEGLHILNWDMRAVKTDKRVLAFYEELN